MQPAANPAHELILGGARSGKSRRAEARAASWLAGDRRHAACLIATALPGDGEMRERIARHQADRAARLPALESVEAPFALGATLRRLDEPRRLLVVDCLTLWLTQGLLPPPGVEAAVDWDGERAALLEALQQAQSPIVLVSNEIGLGVMPMSREARRCVDALGELHQAVAAHCGRVTLMVAGCPLAVKAPA